PELLMAAAADAPVHAITTTERLFRYGQRPITALPFETIGDRGTVKLHQGDDGMKYASITRPFESEPLWVNVFSPLAGYEALRQSTMLRVGLIGLIGLLVMLVIERGVAFALSTRAKNAELRAANLKVEEAMEARSRFFARMSHEIRTPMTGILGMLEQLGLSKLNTDQAWLLRTVTNSAESLITIINDILDFSKIEARKMELENIGFRLRDDICDCMDILAFRAHAKGLELAFHVESDVPDSLIGDPGRLRQILVNLVGNSIKFTATGEVVVHVSTLSRSDDSVELQFSVTDTGVGIPKEKQARMFEAFEQADTSTTREYGGTGLGLAISRQLIELMQGDVHIESEVGKGTTFSFTVKLGIDSYPVVEQRIEKEFLKGLPVLIVDDNATNRMILEEVSHAWGMVPTSADGVDPAIQALERAHHSGSPIQLVLTDMYMPQRDGMDLLQWIRQRPEFSSVPVLILSSGPTAEHRARAAELDVAAYLTKPVRQSSLFDAIATAFEEKGTLASAVRADAAATESTDGRSLNLLLAEDNPVNQLTATTMLGKLGHTVTVANNGREALEQINNQEFDVVFMDVQMPEMDGMAATAAIRVSEKVSGKHMPIVAMTAHAMKGDRERCIEAGMDDYISKPIRRVELKSVLQAIIDRFLTVADADQEFSMTSEGSNTSNRSVFDATGLMDEFDGDKDMLSRMLEIFQRDCDERLPRLRAAVEAGDAAAVTAEAHAFKGGVGNFFATASFQTAQILETMGHSGDVTQAGPVLAKLESEMTELISALVGLTED
ncbi:MAG: response regulator, partial [Planctomycetota bacterium]|nr:response regulator [Planctomycetota bacterium]